MSIAAAFQNANSGLVAAGRRADIVSNNVANALTPGYVRRELVVGERSLDGRGAGVQVVGVQRANDPALTAERRRADGATEKDQIIAGAWRDLNAAMGEPDEAFSLFAQFSGFETALRNLGETPESLPIKNQVLDAAKQLTNTFHSLSNTTQAARRTADRQIAQDVNTVNNALKNIEELNDAIRRLEIGGADASSQRDQRQTLIDDIGKIIPVREIQRDHGAVDIMTEQGVFLLSTTAREIDFSPAGEFAPELNFADGDLSGLSVEGVDITPGGTTLGPNQGRFAGNFLVRDEIGTQFQQQLDGLARDVIERFEGIDPTLAPGDPGLFTDAGAALDPMAENGLAGRIEVNALIDPDRGGELYRLRDGLGAVAEGPNGNADYLRVMLDSLTGLKAPPASTGLSGQMGAAEAAAGLSSLVGGARIRTENTATISASRAEGLKEAELSATAVDTDYELQQLLLIQQAFAANARVIEAADEMLSRLSEI